MNKSVNESNITDSRPDLNSDISLEDFKSFYWLKSELIAFCKKYKIDSSGWKMEISKRIEDFLATGQVADPKPIAVSVRRIKNKRKEAALEVLSVNTIITEDFKRNKATSAFFKSVIGSRFHYTVRLNKFFRENGGKTFQDAIDEWLLEEEEKKLLKANGSDPKPILPQCKYNQFVRDFLKNNTDKGFKDAVAAWNIKKMMRGDNKYKAGDEYLTEQNDLKSDHINESLQ